MSRPATPLSLILDFAQDGDHAFISWRGDLGDGGVFPFKPPYDQDTLPAVIHALEYLQAARVAPLPAEQALLQQVGLWQDGGVHPEAGRIVGVALYASLGPVGQSLLEQAERQAAHENRAIRYLLRFPPTAAGLATLPWELLRGPRHHLLLRPNAQDSCERSILTGMPALSALPPGTRPHLLLLLPHFAVSPEERAAQEQIFQELADAGALTFDLLSPVTADALAERVRTGPRPQLVHYAGHGAYADGDGWLLLDNGRGGTARMRAERFSTGMEGLHLAVIEACQSAMIAEGGLFAGVAPALSQAVGRVVAMQLSIRMEAARHFTRVFYDELLLKAESLQTAVARARKDLFFREQDEASWYVPTLYIRSKDEGPIFLVRERPQGPVFEPLPPPPPPRFQVVPVELNGLLIGLIDTGDGRHWRIEVRNQTGAEVRFLNFTFGRPGAGVTINPTRIDVPRVLAGDIALSEPLELTIAPDADGPQIPFDLAYRVVGAGPGRGNKAFTLRKAE